MWVHNARAHDITGEAETHVNYGPTAHTLRVSIRARAWQSLEGASVTGSITVWLVSCKLTARLGAAVLLMFLTYPAVFNNRGLMIMPRSSSWEKSHHLKELYRMLPYVQRP